MERAIRYVSVERGHDPREFVLLAFGGGGPVHACALARSLQIPKVTRPALPGALSAMGILLADATRERSHTVMLPGEMLQSLDEHFQSLEMEARVEFSAEDPLISFERSVDLRYKGQGYELNVPYRSEAAEAFHIQHERHFGFADRNRQLEYCQCACAVAPAGRIRHISRDRSGIRGWFTSPLWYESNLLRQCLAGRGDVRSRPHASW